MLGLGYGKGLYWTLFFGISLTFVINSAVTSDNFPRYFYCLEAWQDLFSTSCTEANIFLIPLPKTHKAHVSQHCISLKNGNMLSRLCFFNGHKNNLLKCFSKYKQ